MRIPVALGMLLLTPFTMNAGDDLTKDGKLTRTLKLTQLQGGFAGFTGIEYTLEPDGAWSTANVFNKKITPKDKGKLSDKELQALIEVLAKNELTKLPAKAGKAPGANPHSITIEFGKTKATFVSQTPPKTDAKDEVENRFAAIYQGIRGTLKGDGKKTPDRE